MTSTLTSELTLGPLTAAQRAQIMSFAPSLSPQARQLFRRLLILGQEHGLDDGFISHSAAQARAHFEK